MKFRWKRLRPFFFSNISERYLKDLTNVLFANRSTRDYFIRRCIYPLSRVVESIGTSKSPREYSFSIFTPSLYSFLLIHQHQPSIITIGLKFQYSRICHPLSDHHQHRKLHNQADPVHQRDQRVQGVTPIFDRQRNINSQQDGMAQLVLCSCWHPRLHPMLY